MMKITFYSNGGEGNSQGDIRIVLIDGRVDCFAVGNGAEQCSMESLAGVLQKAQAEDREFYAEVEAE